ncbi:MAG: acyl-CoA/acyl-ACP dehydrogenase [Acidimicrobiales bacterium]|nr:acyl-CoA/acyl-ACP dehydrogenase [Acidimicrobiales bacterium]
MISITEEAPVVSGSSDVARRMARIADEISGPAADEVDQQGRFPSETISALRAEGLLSALVPRSLGGMGASYSDLSQGLVSMGRQCASSAMVVAMHHIQVASLVRHGRNDLLRNYMVELVDRQYLLASATTEVGTGGDVGSSVCAVDVADGTFRLEKQAPVISYGRFADGILATARRSADSPENDQVLALCRPLELELEQVGEWNALGFRGTCSPGFILRASGDAAAILDDPYGDVSTQTMLPVAHILWSSLWLGIASAAIDRARRFVQAEARKRPGMTPAAALRLADATALYQQFADLLRCSVARFEDIQDDPDRLSALGFAIAMNSLKVSSSTLVVDVVRQSMVICGLASYRMDTPYSLGRHLRDSIGASLMVNNDRIMGNNAQMLLVHRGE